MIYIMINKIALPNYAVKSTTAATSHTERFTDFSRQIFLAGTKAIHTSSFTIFTITHVFTLSYI